MLLISNARPRAVLCDALLLVLNQVSSRDTRWMPTTIAKFLEVNGRTSLNLSSPPAGALIGAFSMTGVVSSPPRSVADCG
jgi:hypothetical protein